MSEMHLKHEQKLLKIKQKNLMQASDNYLTVGSHQSPRRKNSCSSSSNPVFERRESPNTYESHSQNSDSGNGKTVSHV